MSLNGFHNLLESLAYVIRQFEKKAENPDVEISPNCLFLSSEEHGQFYDFIPPQDQVIKIIIIIYACAYMYVCAGVWGDLCNRTKLTKIVCITSSLKKICLFLFRLIEPLRGRWRKSPDSPERRNADND